MYVLGIQLGHNSTISIMHDGRIVCAVSQERFDNLKNSYIFPADAIDWALKYCNITADMLDAVAVAGLFIYPQQLATLSQGVKKKNLVRDMWRYLHYKENNLVRPIESLLEMRKTKFRENAKSDFLKMFQQKYGVPPSKIHFVEHHVCHAYAGYYAMSGAHDKSLVLTLDGSGDYYCAGVNVADGNKIERIASTPSKHSLGYVYSMTTKFLGMKTLEHEYKVMGLAPYAKSYFLDTYNRIFKPAIWLSKSNPLVFDSAFPMGSFEHYLREHAVGERFDNVAASVQHLTENLVTAWVKNAVEKTGQASLYSAGGVFMNVKMNLRIAQMDEVKSFMPLPSCGDESNPLGACFNLYLNHFSKSANTIKPLENLYLGPEFSNEEIAEFIKKNDLKRKYKVEFHDDMEGEIAELLSKGKIVARFAGRAEWGARALGNRSILGDPSNMETFYTINDQIKQRDFWMPFAPTVLKEREHDYIVNPKNLPAPYMNLAFESTPLAHKELRAAMHQADKTLRAQVLEKARNPKYHRLITEFEKETGIGGVLNTSYNLHGYPLATTPEQAVFTLEKSDLEYLALENYMVSKSK